MNSPTLRALLGHILCLTSLLLVSPASAATSQSKSAANAAPSLQEEATAALIGSSPEIQRLANSAAEKYKKHDYVGAIAELDRLIAIAPQLAGAYNARGYARERNGDLAGAEADFKRVIEIAPKSPQGHLNLGYLKAKRGDTTGAASECRLALQLDPKYGPAYIGLGDLEFAKKDYSKAEADFTRAIAASPNLPLAWYCRSRARLAQDHLADARADVDHALTLNPKYAYAYMTRGAIKHRQNDFSGALADDRRAVEIDPKLQVAYRHIAYIETQQRHYDAALADAQRALAGSVGEDADYTQFLTWSLRAYLGRAAEADRQLSAYFAKRPRAADGDWPGHVGAFLLGREAEDSLLAHAKSGDAKKIDGQRCEAWYYAGLKKLFAGDKAAATERFHQCMATGKKTFYEYELAESELQSP